MEGLYHRSMYIVSIANDFLKQLNNAPDEVDRERYRAEARFCRALAYYVLMDAFANPPFVTEEQPRRYRSKSIAKTYSLARKGTYCYS